MPDAVCAMRRISRALPLALLLALSCAAPSELARRSEHALAAGDVRGAYDWARRGMRADPNNARVRAAMTVAGAAVCADWQMRIRNLAAADTVSAARVSLDFGSVRAELGGWGIPAPLDAAFPDDERRIRHSGAGILCAQGDDAMRERRPREAWRRFVAASEIEPGFRDLDLRIRRAFDAAVVRIAVLPFDDDIGVPSLGQDLGQRVRAQAARNMREADYPFVRFVSGEAIGEKLDTSEPGRLTRDEAIRIGRDLGARRVVWGRISGLHTDTDRDTWHDRVYRKIRATDTSGHTVVRYDEVSFEAVTRHRTVEVAWRFEVLDVDDGATLASREGSERADARTCWTSYEPGGDSDDYCLVPPDWHDARSDDAGKAEKAWKQHYGSWSVPALMKAAHERRDHSRYRHEDLDRFLNASRPEFLDDLPPPEDLAWNALAELWSPVTVVLRALEKE